MRVAPLFQIQTPNGVGLIDRTGHVVVAPTLREIGPFCEGLAAATLHTGKTGFVDESGAFVIEPQFGSVTRFSEGLCAVTTAAGEAFVDRAGREVFRLDEKQRFFEQLVFSEGRCRTSQDGWSGYIDREGRVVVPHRYVDAGVFSDGLASVSGDRKTGRDGSYGFVDPNGATVHPPRWKRAWSFRNGVAAVVSDLKEVDGPILRQFKKDLSVEELRGLWGLVDREGRYRCVPSFDYSETELATTMSYLGGGAFGPADFSEGLALVRRKKKWGFVAEDGTVPIAPTFDKAGHFSEGLAAVQKRKKGGAVWGFVDRRGEVKIAPTFASVIWPSVRFSEGLCPVAVAIDDERRLAFQRVGTYTDALYGFIDASGSFVIEPAFAYPGGFRDGLALVRTTRGLAYIDRQGHVVWSHDAKTP